MVLLLLALFGSVAVNAQPKPNIVFIMTDDVGYGDLGSYGAPDIRTPVLDRLARQGVRFTDFYSNGTTCSPTRAGLITGRYQQRYGIEAPLPSADPTGRAGLPATDHSLPLLLKKAGYATALIGKWHLGLGEDKTPRKHGYDYFFGFKTGYIDYYTHNSGAGELDLWRNEDLAQEEGYMTTSSRGMPSITSARMPLFLFICRFITAPRTGRTRGPIRPRSPSAMPRTCNRTNPMPERARNTRRCWSAPIRASVKSCRPSTPPVSPTTRLSFSPTTTAASG
jgi:arylsulfatase A-like enzyme